MTYNIKPYIEIFICWLITGLNCLRNVRRLDGMMGIGHVFQFFSSLSRLVCSNSLCSFSQNAFKKMFGLFFCSWLWYPAIWMEPNDVINAVVYHLLCKWFGYISSTLIFLLIKQTLLDFGMLVWCYHWSCDNNLCPIVGVCTVFGKHLVTRQFLFKACLNKYKLRNKKSHLSGFKNYFLMVMCM